MKSTTLERNPAAVMGRVTTSYPRLLRILVPLDFSGKSRQALRYAVPLAHKFSARIHLVHVLRPDAKAKPADLPPRRQAAIRRLGDMSALLPPRMRAGNAVLTGKPAEAILGIAEKNSIDLIVLTTKTRAGFHRVLAGGTAETIMRRASCPVLSLRRH